MYDTAINLEGNTWALAVLEPTKLHVTCLAYSYQIDVKTSFKLVELENSCQAYSPNILIPSGNQMSEKKNGCLIQQRFFNYDAEYSAIPNFFLMQTFNITQLTSEEIDALSNDLPIIDKIHIHNVMRMLKNINKNYPFTLPTYRYVLISIGGTGLFICIVGILYYIRFRTARARAPRLKRSEGLNTNDIELQPVLVETSKQPQDLLLEDTSQPTRVTPLLLKNRLEEELGIDFSSYDKFKEKQHRARKHTNKLDEISRNACWTCFLDILNAPG